MKVNNPYLNGFLTPELPDLYKAYILDTVNIQVLEVLRARSIDRLQDLYWNFVYKNEYSSERVILVLNNDLN